MRSVTTELFPHFSQTAENPFRVLMFNVTGDRDGAPMLAELAGLGFDLAVFCSTITRTEDERDNTNFTTSIEGQVIDVERPAAVRTLACLSCLKHFFLFHSIFDRTHAFLYVFIYLRKHMNRSLLDIQM